MSNPDLRSFSSVIQGFPDREGSFIVRRCAPDKELLMLPDQQRNDRTQMKCFLSGRTEAAYDDLDLFNDYVMVSCDLAWESEGGLRNT